jgi:DNA-directed RNA polymerase subunit L
MQKIDKIKINILNHDKSHGNSRLEFKIQGKNLDYISMNTLRRTIMSDIPIYAYDIFKFENNTSVFNNNYIKLRLMNIPAWHIENNITFYEPNKETTRILEEDIYNENDNNEVTQEDYNIVSPPSETTEISKTTQEQTQLTMYVNFKNKSQDILTVTTNDAKFYYNEKIINSPYKTPIPLVDLQPDQEIAFSAISKLGIEEQNAIYSAVSVCYYKQINDNEFDFVIESRGQLNEERIIIVAIDNIIKKMDSFLNLLKSTKINDKLEGIINVNNEGHTLGNIISRGLQQHNNISFAGYKLVHPLSKKLEIIYKLKKADKIINIIEDVINYYSEIYKSIKKQF